MKKHMENLLKLDNSALVKKRAELMKEIVENRRGVIGGEIQNTQVVKSKRKELARVNTLLNMLSNSDAVVVKAEKAVAAKPKTTAKSKETK